MRRAYDAYAKPYEPPRRWGHIAAPVAGKVYLYAGRTKEFSEKDVKRVHVFNTQDECWKEVKVKLVGPLSAGLYCSSAACASIGEHIYAYGGTDKEGLQEGYLHQLNVETLKWIRVPTTGQGPMKKAGHKMVSYGDQLVVFGGRTSGPGRYCTNELHVFDTKEGK